MTRTTKIIAVAVAACALVAGAIATAGYIAAQEPDAPKRERADAFIGKVAANLGVSPDALRQAIKDAETQTVDEAIGAGRLTPEEGAKIKERIASSEGLGFGALHRRHDKMRHERGGGIRGNIIGTAAEAIGVSKEELGAELRAGKSIAEVASEHGVGLDAVKAAIVDATKTKLDAAVAAGKIDQANADERLQKLADKLDELLNKKKQPGG